MKIISKRTCRRIKSYRVFRLKIKRFFLFLFFIFTPFLYRYPDNTVVLLPSVAISMTIVLATKMKNVGCIVFNEVLRFIEQAIYVLPVSSLSRLNYFV